MILAVWLRSNLDRYRHFVTQFWKTTSCFIGKDPSQPLKAIHLLQLKRKRKVCNHPDLLRFPDDLAGSDKCFPPSGSTYPEIVSQCSPRVPSIGTVFLVRSGNLLRTRMLLPRVWRDAQRHVTEDELKGLLAFKEDQQTNFGYVLYVQVQTVSGWSTAHSSSCHAVW